MKNLETLTYELLMELETMSPEDIKQTRREWIEEMKRTGISNQALRFVNLITNYVLSEACKTV